MSSDNKRIFAALTYTLWRNIATILQHRTTHMLAHNSRLSCY